MNEHNHTNEDLDQYFTTVNHTPEEKTKITRGWIENKPYLGTIIKTIKTRTSTETTPMKLWVIDFEIESGKKEVAFSIIFYEKNHKYYGMRIKNQDELADAMGADPENLPEDFLQNDKYFIGEKVYATFVLDKKDNTKTRIKNLMKKGVVEDMEKSKGFNDDIPF